MSNTKQYQATLKDGDVYFFGDKKFVNGTPIVVSEAEKAHLETSALTKFKDARRGIVQTSCAFSFELVKDAPVARKPKADKAEKPEGDEGDSK